MKKIYVKPETMVICTEPVVICAGSPQTGWNNDGTGQGGVYPDGSGSGGESGGGFDPDDWGNNN